MRIGLPELIIIAFVILIFVNPRDFPGLFRKIGKFFQQIKEARDSFTRTVRDWEKELSPALSTTETGEPAVQPAFARAEKQIVLAVSDPVRGAHGLLPAMTLESEIVSLQWLTCAHASPSAPVSVHFSIHGGVGDRVIFQGIVSHAVQIEGSAARVVAATYDCGEDYYCKDYLTPPHEIWQVRRPWWTESRDGDIAREFARTASLLFPDAPSVRVKVYGGPMSSVNDDPSISYTELYAHYSSTLAPLGLYPRFALDESIERDIETLLALACPPGVPRVAIHARQLTRDQEKNLCPTDLLELARRLVQRGFRLVLFCDEPPPDLRRICCYLCPFDPSLQVPAALLKHCDVFVGGDSGPGHLAAAVGASIVSIRRMDPQWVNGPFCPKDRLAVVEGAVVQGEAGASLSFDVLAVLERLDDLLASR